MSEDQNELETLKAKADSLGLKYHHKAGVDKLKELVSEAEEKPEQELTEGQLRAKIKKEATKQIRIVVNCLNPEKREWEGELITVGNKIVGTISKFVPFNVEAGYHVPHIVYEQLVQRQCVIHVKGKDKNKKTNVPKLIKEFSIDVLEPLTKQELENLAKKQEAERSIE